jgi:predicted RNA methylase
MIEWSERETWSALVADALRRQRVVEDTTFDRIYAAAWRRASGRFWTPVRVALRAAEWLTEGGATRILDVGSGVGKVCIVGALSTRARFTGIEHRARLVQAARTAARRLGADGQTSFLEGEIREVDLTRFDGLYLYNPFGENQAEPEDWLDDEVEIGAERFHRDASVVERALDAAPLGARMVTFHGFGGAIPDTYELERAESIGGGLLRLWVKRRLEKRAFLRETCSGTLPACRPFPYVD